MFDAIPTFLAQDAPPPNVPDAPAAGPANAAPNAGNGDATTTADGGTQTGNAPANAPPPGMGSEMWLFLLLILVVMWVFMIGGGRKEKKRKAAMLAAMGKGDKVQTVGGILGTIVEVRDDEVVVKVDENTNSRLRFSKSAIQAVLDREKS